MNAGGYLISAPKTFMPVSLHVQWTACFVRFEKVQDVKDFCDWLRSANEKAEYSFTRMSD